MSGLAAARAVDELRRGQPVLIRDGAIALAALAVELADDASLAAFEAGRGRSGLLITGQRAALLHLVNQRAAAGMPAVLVHRAPWMDLANALAAADPVRDLASPLKGPYETADLGGAGAAAEAALRLAKLAGLLPALLVLSDPVADADWLAVDAGDVASFAHAASLRIVTRARLPLEGAEKTEVVAFRSAHGGPEHLALIVGDPPRDRPVLIRLHSACLTGDVLGSLKCDCGPQLRGALTAIASEGSGIILYLQQEGRGIGLINKLRAYALQDQGFDTVDANLRLGFEVDERDFGLAAAMLGHLGIAQVRLLTNNPAKVAALGTHGVTVVERVPLAIDPGTHNREYLAVKRDRTGHYL